MDANETQPAPRADDRTGTVDPTDNPVPANPPVDEEALGKGKEPLERVKPY